MSKADVHFWLCQPYNDRLLNIDIVHNINDLILSTIENKGLVIKNYIGNHTENRNIFLMNLIKFIYLNRYTKSRLR